MRSSEASLGPTLLTIAFVVLKLCRVIEWSWWWVLSPVWITASLALLLLTVYLAFFAPNRTEGPRP